MFTRINNIVTNILFDFPEARDDDNILYIKVIDEILPGASQKTFADILTNLKKYKLPPFESVSRARRKVQELRKDLRGSEKSQDIRKQEEFNYWLYYR